MAAMKSILGPQSDEVQQLLKTFKIDHLSITKFQMEIRADNAVTASIDFFVESGHMEFFHKIARTYVLLRDESIPEKVEIIAKDQVDLHNLLIARK